MQIICNQELIVTKKGMPTILSRWDTPSRPSRWDTVDSENQVQLPNLKDENNLQKHNMGRDYFLAQGPERSHQNENRNDKDRKDLRANRLPLNEKKETNVSKMSLEDLEKKLLSEVTAQMNKKDVSSMDTAGDVLKSGVQNDQPETQNQNPREIKPENPSNSSVHTKKDIHSDDKNIQVINTRPSENPKKLQSPLLPKVTKKDDLNPSSVSTTDGLVWVEKIINSVDVTPSSKRKTDSSSSSAPSPAIHSKEWQISGQSKTKQLSKPRQEKYKRRKSNDRKHQSSSSSSTSSDSNSFSKSSSSPHGPCKRKGSSSTGKNKWTKKKKSFSYVKQQKQAVSTSSSSYFSPASKVPQEQQKSSQLKKSPVEKSNPLSSTSTFKSNPAKRQISQGGGSSKGDTSLSNLERKISAATVQQVDSKLNELENFLRQLKTKKKEQMVVEGKLKKT